MVVGEVISQQTRLRRWLSRKCARSGTVAFDGEPCIWTPSPVRSRRPVSAVPRGSAARPRGVGTTHSSDERSDLWGDVRAAWPVPAALPGPEELEAGPLPPDHGCGLNDGHRIRPAAPQAGQQDPEQPVGGSQPWTRRGALEDGQLVPQREVLEHQGAAGSQHAEEACDDEGDHAGHHRSGRPKLQR